MANVITDVGLNKTAEMIGGVATVDPFNYLAIGTGTTAAAAGDTQLEAEVVREQATASVSGGTLTLDHTFTFTTSYAITELGVLNAATAGDLYGRSTFGAINVANGDSLQLTVDIAYARG
jgi:hypothetical protein